MNSGSKVIWSDGTVPVVDPDCLTSLIAAMSDLAFVITAEGRIASVLVDQRSLDHARLSGWADQLMQDFLTTESIPKFQDALATMVAHGEMSKAVELNHSEGGQWRYPVRYTFHGVGRAGSILMMGRDLRMVAETQEQLVQAQIALERGYEERRENDARYRVVMANTRDAFVFVAPDGRIRDANIAAARLLDAEADSLVGAPIAKEFKHRRKGEFLDALSKTAMLEPGANITVQTVRGGQDLRIVPLVFRVAGERLILCRLLQDVTTGTPGDRLGRLLDALYHRSTDGVVICDTDGIILEANEAFLDLVNVPSASEVKTRGLGQFLQRGQVDMNVMLDTTLKSGHMRFYATRLVNELGQGAGAEISAFYLSDSDDPAVGFVIRDADRANAFRETARLEPDEEPQAQSVSELVGAASLKEIVAETSDVIEKMCIETALDLTRNNRAAAASMLGVSRQSLYVKLRKHGMLKREDD